MSARFTNSFNKKHTLLGAAISAAIMLSGCQTAPMQQATVKPVVQHSQTQTNPVISKKVSDEVNTMAAEVKALFQIQQGLLDNALDNVQPSNPDEVEWYFVGVAGYAGQNVFRTETNFVRQLFDKNFKTEGHSIALINNRDSWEQEPIATKETLEAAIKEVGQKMGDEDVLFLGMTSHGNRDRFVLQNYIIDIDDIDPDWLRKTLDDAGIKWRVLAVSSCYSGSFIDELITPETAIITAASKDRSSFGCSQLAKMTYFGRAFYQNSLPNASSFKEAYDNASVEIKARESAQGFQSSNPQMVVGDAMKVKLPLFEQALFANK